MNIPKKIPSTEDQQQILEKLKESLGNNNREFSDNLLIQFLEANIWNINDAKQQFMDTIIWRDNNHINRIPIATKYNNVPVLIACRGYQYIDDTNFTVQPGLSESVVRTVNCIGGDCFHKFDKEGHPILIDRTVKLKQNNRLYIHERYSISFFIHIYLSIGLS
ncbi:uncharacterized protein BX663DRAFT_307156 [Cokeromyces recurvatus]|uniref:uncharacterized protein n=1 Tax=Cokeromyces recurvatus TaxID=90255 RepID=UPI00221FF9EA|nr:uncharacterized protein BX663DRAFT_307156 [Cokeromyces recurvatus]KAI7904986.1 hypothetical protein BX663DRAFT_307156 [Cokeromyces recurvatus]